jgi:hypothetical protein
MCDRTISMRLQGRMKDVVPASNNFVIATTAIA